MKRRTLSKILHLLVKDYQEKYLKLKKATDKKYPEWRTKKYTIDDEHIIN